MRYKFMTAALALGCAATAGHAVNVYMFSSGTSAVDDAVVLALTSRGHTVVRGVEYTAFTGSESLAGIDTVYLQANANWTSGPMPSLGQQQLVHWVQTGGRLVTSEWVAYFSYEGSNFGLIGTILPVTPPTSFTNYGTVTLTLATPNATIRAGVPDTFTAPLDSFSGTETFTAVKSGASLYYVSQNIFTSIPGLAGWRVGAGYVYSFTSTCGATQVADATFGRLLSNTMGAVTPPCETSDFNGDGDAGTDADIEAFFACLAGNCCETCPPTADFNGDGDIGTDADIEAFFRVLAGGAC